MNSVEKVFESIEERLHHSSDIKSRDVSFLDTKLKICYIADITDNLLLNNTLIFPLLNYKGGKDSNIVEMLSEKILSNNEDR